MSQIPSKLIADLAITEAKIGTGAVTGGKIADNAVDSQHYADASIDAAHLSAEAKAVPLQEKLGLFFNRINSVALGTGTSVSILSKVISSFFTKRILHDGVTNNIGIPQSTVGYDKIMIIDASTGDPIIDGSSRQVFGRMIRTIGAKSGTVTASTSSADVVGVSTAFTTEYAVGDHLFVHQYGLSGDSLYLGQIASITDDLNLTLTGSSYWDATGYYLYDIGLNCNFYVNDGGSMVAYTALGQTADMQYSEMYNLYDVPKAAFSSGVGFAEGLPAGHNHDDRYYTETELDNGQLDNRYFTETELGSVTHAADGAALIGFEETGWSATNAHDAILEAKAGSLAPETITIATQDTFPELARTPVDSTKVMLYVFGRLCEYGATKDYTCAGKQITWYEATAGYHVDPGDPVTAVYA